MYELKLIELDHRGVTNKSKTLKTATNLNQLKEDAERYKNKLEKANDFARNTFYIKFIIYENQDLIVYKTRKPIKTQIEW